MCTAGEINKRCGVSREKLSLGLETLPEGNEDPTSGFRNRSGVHWTGTIKEPEENTRREE